MKTTTWKTVALLLSLSASASAFAVDYKAECVGSLENPSAEQTDACGAITDEYSLSCVQYLSNPEPQQIHSCGLISNENSLSCVNVMQAFKSAEQPDGSVKFTSRDIDRCSEIVSEAAIQCVIGLSYPKFVGFESCKNSKE
ncbi:MAG: hypothetical protein ACJ763_02640 [Bdellovibrionia bacterium]